MYERQPRPEMSRLRYERLPHGPHGLTRAQVVENQRRRIQLAALETAALRGCDRITVKAVIELSGVSRRAFYEHFANIHDCFATAIAATLDEHARHVAAAYNDGADPSARLHRALAAHFEWMDRHPVAARATLVLACSSDSAPRSLVQRSWRRFEPMIAAALADPCAQPALREVLGRMLVGGIRRVSLLRARGRMPGPAGRLAEVLQAWVLAYRQPPVALAVEECRPNGARGVRARGRLLDDRQAVLEVFAQRVSHGGWEAAFCARQIATQASVSLTRYRELFSTEEECFLALLDEFTSGALEAIRGAAPGSGWPRAACRRASAFVEYLAGLQGGTRLLFLEPWNAGAQAAEHAGELVARLTGAMIGDAPVTITEPRVLCEAVAGSIEALFAEHATRPDGQALRAIAQLLCYLIVAPYTSPDARRHDAHAGVAA